jgi:peptidyl-prolyl cis-trans isomerase D
MAKESRKNTNIPTKKHLARQQREKRQVQIITSISIAVILLVVGVLAYGYLDQQVLKGRRAVITVNDDKISVNDFRAVTKYYRFTLIQQANNTLQMAQMFGPELAQSFTGQLTQIKDNLEPERAGQVAIDQLVDSTLLRQEAERRGISISQEELDNYAQEALNYFPNGTPTPTATTEQKPTSTLSAMQLTMMPPTATATTAPADDVTTEFTATATLEFTPTATEILTSTATPTVYTFDAFQENYDTMISNFMEDYEIPEKTILYVMESQLYQQKLFEEIVGDLECTQEEVWAQHILVDEEDLAKNIKLRLDEGEDWALMAATYSTDESNKNTSGDLGWFGKGRMVEPFEEAAFALEIGEVSDPVQTDFGWHIIRVLGHEERPLTSSACQEFRQAEFQKWLKELRDNSEVEIKDSWNTVVPLLPELSEEMVNIINGLSVPQANPTPVPTE